MRYAEEEQRGQEGRRDVRRTSETGHWTGLSFYRVRADTDRIGHGFL
jgi:hypothetical protein